MQVGGFLLPLLIHDASSSTPDISTPEHGRFHNQKLSPLSRRKDIPIVYSTPNLGKLCPSTFPGKPKSILGCLSLPAQTPRMGKQQVQKPPPLKRPVMVFPLYSRSHDFVSLCAPPDILVREVLLDSLRLAPKLVRRGLYLPYCSPSSRSPPSTVAPLGTLWWRIVVVTKTLPGEVSVFISSLRSSEMAREWASLLLREAEWRRGAMWCWGGSKVELRLGRWFSAPVEESLGELFEPALSLEVTHWITMAEKRTRYQLGKSSVKGGVGEQTIAVAAHETHPAGLTIKRHQNTEVSRTVSSRSPIRRRNKSSYTMLLISVQTAPRNVRKATPRRRIFAGLLGIFLNE